MKKRHLLKLFIISVFAISILAACGDKDESKEKDAKSKENTEVQDTTKEKDDGKGKAEEADEMAEEDTTETEDTSGAVKPKSASETISFDQVTWFGGSPKREADAGVWYYTESDHPDKYDDTFDWEDEDILLWQIGDEKYQGYNADTEYLKIMDDDVIKIIVSFEEDAIGEDMPRNFLKVSKGALEDQSFIIETVDGEKLSLQ